MEHFAVGQGGLDAVADRVAEVEEGPDVLGFVFVRLDDARLDRDVAGEEIGGDIAFFGIDGEEIVKHGGIADRGVLDRFREAFVKLPGGEGAEGLGIDDDKLRLVEGSEQVFPFGDVHAGLAADG